jgi:hypothetical protein
VALRSAGAVGDFTLIQRNVLWKFMFSRGGIIILNSKTFSKVIKDLAVINIKLEEPDKPAEVPILAFSYPIP